MLTKEECVAEVNRHPSIRRWNMIRKQYINGLRQNHAKEFSGLSAKDRKQVEILTAEETMIEDGYIDPRD